MSRHRLSAALLAALAALAVTVTSAPVGAASAPPGMGVQRLEVYQATVSADVAADLQQRFDHDFHEIRTLEDGRVEVAVVLDRITAAKLRREGVSLQLSRNAQGQTATQAAEIKAREGYRVFRRYLGAGGIADEVRDLHRKYPKITEVVTIGQSLRGTPILALRVTADAQRVDDGSRPAALYLGTQHAREWISPEVTRRLMRHFVEGHAGDRELRSLIAANEYWFVPVANPDGYDHTFTAGNRLWRKNLRDNDGDGEITPDRDGVDLNRNFPTHWGYDDEGSSSEPGSATYRGTAPASEPETRALDGLMRRIGFNFVLNYHSAAELILYGVGWQVNTRTPDDLVYEALAGDDARPAVPGFDPDLSAELYTTNGDTTDHAHEAHGSLAFTPELTECQTVASDASSCESVFNFPDDPDLVVKEFQRNVPFALDIARSTARPADPVSHLGNKAPAFKADPFTISYGTPQPVAVWAARRLGAVTLHYRLNGGAERTATTAEWQGGERYGDTNDVHYREVRGIVPTGSPGDAVEVWFTGGGATSERFTYTVASDTGRDVLVLAAEDYTGVVNQPAYASSTSPNHLDAYRTALADSGIAADEYDVDARGRTAPHHLGVLGHYDAVLWYSGNDLVTRRAGGAVGTASKLASDLEVSVRDYLNEGGKVVVTGQHFGFQQSNGYPYNPAGEPPDCPVQPEECIPLSDDFLQYYLGAYKHNRGAGTSALTGTKGPFDGLVLGLDGADSAQNQVLPSSLLVTSSFLPKERYPQFSSSATLQYDREGGAPYEPHSGTTYAFSRTGDISFKRLTRTVQVPAAGGKLSFWVSADTEPHWDYLAVEARTAGQDDWTTLPDENGLTTQETGDSCAEGWRSLHPKLDHYQTLKADGTCTSTGSTGTWHAFTGNSGGWKQWVADLSAYRGKEVELSISYVSDWAFQGLGVFVDDIAVPGEPVQDLETGLGAWTVPGAPVGSAPNPNDWVSSGTAFQEGAAVRTADTHFFAFGIEGVTGRQQRAELVRRALADLLQR